MMTDVRSLQNRSVLENQFINTIKLFYTGQIPKIKSTGKVCSRAYFYVCE